MINQDKIPPTYFGPRRWRDVIFLPRDSSDGTLNNALLSEYFEDLDLLQAIQELTTALESALREARLGEGVRLPPSLEH